MPGGPRALGPSPVLPWGVPRPERARKARHHVLDALRVQRIHADRTASRTARAPRITRQSGPPRLLAGGCARTAWQRPAPKLLGRGHRVFRVSIPSAQPRQDPRRLGDRCYDRGSGVPSVIVVAASDTDKPSAFNHDRRTFQRKERVTSSDVSDPHVPARLIERIGWALADAHHHDSVDTEAAYVRRACTQVARNPPGERDRQHAHLLRKPRSRRSRRRTRACATQTRAHAACARTASPWSF